MRKALNENPMVQIAVIGIAAVAFAMLLFTTVLKGEEPVPPDQDPAALATEAGLSDPAAAQVAEPPVTDPAATVDPAAAPVTPVPPSGSAQSADGLLPSKGLPEDLLVAFARDKAIALLVVEPRAAATKKVEEFTRALKSKADIEVFVVKTKDIARYSRITTGVAVTQTPALVVVRPRKLTDNVPTASVSYGFRGPKSVTQALDDALFEGKQVTNYP